MGFAHANIRVQIGGEVIELRASLRAATRLCEKYESFHAILQSLRNQELGVIATVIAETSVRPCRVDEVLQSLTGYALRALLDTLIPAVAEVVFHLAETGEPETKKRKPTEKGKLVTFAKYHLELYRLATGWLGWTPEVAWAASPAEIIQAHRGRVALVSAVFGGSTTDDDDTDERDPDAVNILKGLM